MTVFAAGLGGFIASGLICAVGCYAILMSISTAPAEENVVAGAASHALLMLYAGFGIGFTFVTAFITGILFAVYVSKRMSHRGCS
jgi:hypothetical protein